MFLMELMKKVVVLFTITALIGCVSEKTAGPDKQFSGELGGALTGAGAGAVTGFQIGAGTGPGAAVGAGFGAVAGGIHGMLRDQTEENMVRLANATREERGRAIAQEILADHYRRRLEIHPGRDIYPADLFFQGDEVTIRPCSRMIVKELAKLNRDRMAWSRLQIAVYTKARDKDSQYASYLSRRRAIELGNELVNSGIESRRIETKAVVVDEPILIDPEDDPTRYSQAVELITVDR